MKRLAAFCILFFTLMITVGLMQTAFDPNDYTGEWYSSEDQSLYLFQHGLIYCPKKAVPTSDSTFISGAYTQSKNAILLFAVGIKGLETERVVFLIQNDDVTFLCENADGTGQIFFIRSHK